MATHSSTLAWKIPWTEEPGRLQSMGSRRVGHDWATSLSLFHFHALEKEMATRSSILAWRIPGTGAWWATVYGVAQSWTRLTWLSSSSKTRCFTWTFKLESYTCGMLTSRRSLLHFVIFSSNLQVLIPQGKQGFSGWAQTAVLCFSRVARFGIAC